MLKNKLISIVLLPILAIIIVAILSACSGNNSESAENSAGDYDMAANDSDNGFVEADQEQVNSESSEAELERSEGQSDEQMVIYNGNISIEVNDFNDAQKIIQDEVDRIGGFVVESSVYQQGQNNQKNGMLIVRVPQEHFQPFLNELETTSSKVLEKSTSGNDVTEEYIDLESRLRSKETVEKRLLAFLEEAENTKDLLTISSDLSEVQEEIEQIKGRMSYLQNHVKLSTVTIHIQESSINVSTLQDGQSLNTLEHAKSLFMDTVNVLISLFSRGFIMMVGLSPVIIPMILIGLAVYFLQKRHRKNKPKKNE